MSDASTICQRMRVPGFESVYLIGCRSTCVTIHAQQTRAFNLAWSLRESRTMGRKDRVAVVGGGFAGMTFSAAVADFASVSLFEKASELLHIQRGNHTRYVHPNIYYWPDKRANEKSTHFPFFNWSAGTPSEIVRNFDSEWEPYSKYLHDLHLGADICGVTTSPAGRPSLLVHSGGREELSTYDIVVLAVGFGLEKGYREWKPVSYWRNDALHQPKLDPKDRGVTIIGYGDGGLVDAIRACLVNFDHEELTGSVANHHELIRVGEQMKSLDSIVVSMEQDAARDFLDREYAKIDLPSWWMKRLRQNLRKDSDVLMVGRSATPYRTGTSILNRLILVSLFRLGAIRYITEESFDEGTATNVFPRTGTLPALGRLLPDPPSFEYDKQEDLGLEAYWPLDPFPRHVVTRKLIRVTIATNKIWRHAETLFEGVKDALREHAPEGYQFHSDHLSLDSTMPTGVQTCLEEHCRRFAPDWMVVLSSDLAGIFPLLTLSTRNLVFLGEQQATQRAILECSSHLPEIRVGGVCQEIDFAEMLELLERMLPGKRIVYLLSNNATEYPLDEEYLAKVLELAPRHCPRVIWVPHRVEDHNFDPGSLRSLGDVFTGRYCIHRFGDVLFSSNLPVISSYLPDVHRGAVFCIDTDDREAARMLVEDVIVSGVMDANRPLRQLSAKIPLITISLANAKAKQFVVADELRSLAHQMLE